MVCEFANAYGIGKITAYDVDQNGNPILATRREIVTGLDVPYGTATDPLTGDLLFTSYLSTTSVLRSAPVPTTTTVPPITTTIPTTTSTMVPPTTSTTAPPTTTSTTTSTTTTSSTSTTTLPSGCTSGPSFPSIACQVERLLDLVRASSTLGPLQPAFVARFERAQQSIGADAHALRGGLSCP